MRAAVAAGHPATVDAGIEILEEGGNAADAAVAASLASCVAETVMTGLLGGGHAIVLRNGEVRTLDFFVAVPGLGAEPRVLELEHLEVPFGTELVHYAVGIGSCGVPGVLAGLGELWRRDGSLPWARLVEAALRLAHKGTDFPRAQAACLEMLAPVMTMREGGRIYRRDGGSSRRGEAGAARPCPRSGGDRRGRARSPTVESALLAHGAARRSRDKDDLETYEPRGASRGRVERSGLGSRPASACPARFPLYRSVTGSGPVRLARRSRSRIVTGTRRI